MSLAVVTGSAGLVGSEAAAHFHGLGFDVWGVDNDMRRVFFGDEASTVPRRRELEESLPRYRHFDLDVRDRDGVEALFARGGEGISAVIHAAAQPSHDWAAGDPLTDFTVNAGATLTLLEATRRHCRGAVFVFVSTNKVYGDAPNRLPFVELETRYDLPEDHPLHGGVPESLTIDRSKHSLFGVSKAAADLMVQEYGRYFGLATCALRAGCITGAAHAGAELHGFLAYLMKCVVTGRPYTVYGYRGKQVRDNIHSADLASAFEQVVRRPRAASVYNIGGGRRSNCSVAEAIALCEEIAGRRLERSYREEPRAGDHIWWISDLSTFEGDYPEWQPRYDVPAILDEIHERNAARWRAQAA